MSTPQDPSRRRKQKARRTKQLSAWRATNPKNTKPSESHSEPSQVTKAERRPT